MFEPNIKTDNAAFHDDAGGVPDDLAKYGEVRRILHRVIESIEHGNTQGLCLDYNGNVVGEWMMR